MGSLIPCFCFPGLFLGGGYSQSKTWSAVSSFPNHFLSKLSHYLNLLCFYLKKKKKVWETEREREMVGGGRGAEREGERKSCADSPLNAEPDIRRDLELHPETWDQDLSRKSRVGSLTDCATEVPCFYFFRRKITTVPLQSTLQYNNLQCAPRTESVWDSPSAPSPLKV